MRTIIKISTKGSSFFIAQYVPDSLFAEIKKLNGKFAAIINHIFLFQFSSSYLIKPLRFAAYSKICPQNEAQKT